MHQDSSWDSALVFILRLVGRNLPLVTFFVLALAGTLFVYWFFSPPTDSTAQAIALNSNVALSAPIYKAIPDRPVIQRLRQSPGPLRIGIIAGHLGSDSGAVCDDGLTEAQITSDIAQQVAEQLTAQGIPVDILEEFDARLSVYGATAVVSIHADSCVFLNDQVTGFKIASSSFTDSSELEACLEREYQTTTQMRYNANTITEHMTDYHAFRAIPAGVPALILETGFMGLDREMLTTNSHIPAQGIVNGILCYVRGATS